MHVISRKPFNDGSKRFPNDSDSLISSYKSLRNGDFSNPEEMKKVFSSLDRFKYKEKWWVIDIGGNNLRLIAIIEFRDNRMYEKHIVNHSDYDKLYGRSRRGEL